MKNMAIHKIINSRAHHNKYGLSTADSIRILHLTYKLK